MTHVEKVAWSGYLPFPPQGGSARMEWPSGGVYGRVTGKIKAVTLEHAGELCRGWVCVTPVEVTNGASWWEQEYSHSYPAGTVLSREFFLEEANVLPRGTDLIVSTGAGDADVEVRISSRLAPEFHFHGKLQALESALETWMSSQGLVVLKSLGVEINGRSFGQQPERAQDYRVRHFRRDFCAATEMHALVEYVYLAAFGDRAENCIY